MKGGVVEVLDREIKEAPDVGLSVVLVCVGLAW